MPRLSELTYNNRHDIRCAINRFYGNVNNLCLETKTLIPFNEWNYFENQLLLFHSLKEYMQQNKLDHKYFPLLTNIRKTNPILFKHVQQYGGKKLLARRLDMCLAKKSSTTKINTSTTKKDDNNYLYNTSTSIVTTKLQYEELNYGKFSLDFGIEIMEYIRNDLLQYDPPITYKEVSLNKKRNNNLMMPSSSILMIAMPSKESLLLDDREDLIDKIMLFGGFECVARRLGLYF